MKNISAGLLAGFVATVVLSVMMMIAKAMMGVMPDLNVIAMIGNMMGASVGVGWIVHFMIGTIAWGAGFSVIEGMLPGSSVVVKGIVFGIAAWFGMMIVVMPMAGAGLFGMNMSATLGFMTPIMTLVLHIVFGAVLGVVYQIATSRLSPPEVKS